MRLTGFSVSSLLLVYFSFYYCSFDPERLWVITRATGTNDGSLVDGDNLVIESTGNKYVAGPEAWSFSFDQDGLCYR